MGFANFLLNERSFIMGPPKTHPKKNDIKPEFPVISLRAANNFMQELEW